MAARHKCTGTEEEVRSAIQAAGRLAGDQRALASCLRTPVVAAARPLDVLLKDWGRDRLVPQLLAARVHEAASL